LQILINNQINTSVENLNEQVKEKTFWRTFQKIKKTPLVQPNPGYTTFTSLEDYKRSIYDYKSFVPKIPYLSRQTPHFVFYRSGLLERLTIFKLLLSLLEYLVTNS